MYEIHPIQSKDEQAALCALCEVTYRPEAMAYKLAISGEFAGVCQFIISNHSGIILDMAQTVSRRADKCDDFEEFFIMARAALNFVDLCGIHTGVWAVKEPKPLEDTDRLIKVIGFRDGGDGRLSVDLTDMFDHPCQHKH